MFRQYSANLSDVPGYRFEVQIAGAALANRLAASRDYKHPWMRVLKGEVGLRACVCNDTCTSVYANLTETHNHIYIYIYTYVHTYIYVYIYSYIYIERERYRDR